MSPRSLLAASLLITSTMLPSTTYAGEFDVCEAALKQGWRQGEEDRIFYYMDFKFNPLPGSVFTELDRLFSALKKRGVEPIVLAVPTPAHVNARYVKKLPEDAWDASQADAIYNAVRARLSRNASVVDVLKVAQTSKDAFYYKRDYHWTVAGARETAFATAQLIKTHPAYAKLPRVESKAEVISTKTYDSSGYSISVGELCKRPMSHEQAPRVESRRLTAPAPVAIIEAAPVPSITVVGSSFMEPVRGFSPYLMEATQAEVLTLSLNGGQTLGALLGYLRSEEFQKTPPQYLVWEVPLLLLGAPPGSVQGSTAFQDPLIYRQLIASVEGSCSGPKVALSGRFTLAGAGPQVLMENSDQKALSANTHILELRMDIPTQDTFQVETEFSDGTVDVYPFVNHKRVTSNGRFYLSYPAESEALIKKISVSTPQGYTGGMTGRLCSLGGTP